MQEQRRRRGNLPVDLSREKESEVPMRTKRRAALLKEGLAWRILEAANRLRTAEMFAALVVLAPLGLIVHALIGWGRSRAVAAWSGRLR